MTDQGKLIQLDGKPALQFERRYRHPMARVWRAMSDPAEMSSWFPSSVEGERAVGAELLFIDDAQRAAAREAGEPTRDDGPMFRGRVVVYDPPRVFSFTWGSELLRFELHPDGDDTVLVFTQILSHQSTAARNGSGWHMCLASLDALLDDGRPEHDGWQEVYDTYLALMGPALGTPGDAGTMTWERATHVDADRVREVTTNPTEIEAWGGDGPSDAPMRWDIEQTAQGTVYRLVHEGIGDDAVLAARWHALLVQLDMYLAAGQLIPVEPKRWLDTYAELLRTQNQ